VNALKILLRGERKQERAGIKKKGDRNNTGTQQCERNMRKERRKEKEKEEGKTGNPIYGRYHRVA
jgi:hypothetical protein